jgi:hypothetical protein
MDMVGVPSNVLLAFTSGFSMAGKFDDDGTELPFKKSFLIVPYVLSSPAPWMKRTTSLPSEGLLLPIQ